MRTKAESELEGVKAQHAADLEKLRVTRAGQAEAARLAADLEAEQTLHQEAKAQIVSLQSRYLAACLRLPSEAQ